MRQLEKDLALTLLYAKTQKGVTITDYEIMLFILPYLDDVFPIEECLKKGLIRSLLSIRDNFKGNINEVKYFEELLIEGITQ